jgi:hypothetical protein
VGAHRLAVARPPRRPETVRALLAAAALLLAGSSLPAAEAPKPPSCEEPAARLAIHSLGEAAEAYGKLLEKSPDLTCALEGRQAVVAAYLERSRVFESVGDAAEAKAAATAALKLDPASVAARERLARLVDPYLEARKLLALNQRAAAVSEAQKVRAEQEAAGRPTVPPSEIEALDGGFWARWLPWWRWLESWLTVAPFTAAALVVLAWLLLRAWLGLRPATAALTLALAWLAARLWLGLEPLPGYASVLSLALTYRLMHRPRLEIRELGSAGLSGDPGKDVTALMRSHLSALARPEAGGGWSLTTGHTTTIEIPAAIETIVPAGKSWLPAIPPLLQWLSARPVVKLGGELHPPGERGVGLTLELSRGKRYLSSETLWQKDFGFELTQKDAKAGDFYALAEAAAVWLLFEMLEHT